MEDETMVDGAAIELKKKCEFNRGSIKFSHINKYLQALDLDSVRANEHLVMLIAEKPVYLACLAVDACKCLVI